VSHGQWRLAPAFDVNPFPDKDQELKTWLSEDTGPVSSIEEVVRVAAYFWLKPDQALRILEHVYMTIRNWRDVAMTAAVGMAPHDMSAFTPAFEHAQMKRAATLLAR
jgi:serine/threonine-protein kinase HipA